MRQPPFEIRDIHPWRLEHPGFLTLEGDDICIWRLPAAADPRSVAPLWAVLAPEERERARRLRRPEDHTTFVIARGALRMLTAAYLDRPPLSIEFEYGPRGKPALAPCGIPLQFNLTHTGELCLIAFSRRRILGVDAERLDRPLRVESFARRILGAQELEAFARVPEPMRRRALLEAWVRKEAYLKATGEGLAGGPGTVAVSLAPDEPARFLDGPPVAAGWDLWALDLGPGYVGALAASPGSTRRPPTNFT